MHIPDKTRQLWDRHGVQDQEIVGATLPSRCVYVSGAANDGQALTAAEGQAIPWLPQFYELRDGVLPRQVDERLASAGQWALGMDVSSGAAVAALQLQPGMHVLDLCCAPGPKMLVASQQVRPGGSITGVDVSSTRACVARTLLSRHAAWGVRVVVADGRRFEEPPPANPVNDLDRSDVQDAGWWRRWLRRQNRGKRAREEPLSGLIYAAPVSLGHQNTPLKNDPKEGSDPTTAAHLYDRVLVDAPCTLDGAIRLQIRHGKTGHGSANADEEKDLHRIQEALLRQAVRMTKPGGRIVYSTCSMVPAQNEAIVLRILAEGHCRLVDCGLPPAAPSSPVPSLPGAVLFVPSVSNTSGLFIAALLRL